MRCWAKAQAALMGSNGICAWREGSQIPITFKGLLVLNGCHEAAPKRSGTCRKLSRPLQSALAQAPDTFPPQPCQTALATWNRQASNGFTHDGIEVQGKRIERRSTEHPMQKSCLRYKQRPKTQVPILDCLTTDLCLGDGIKYNHLINNV